jgi:hypothetical protein
MESLASSNRTGIFILMSFRKPQAHTDDEKAEASCRRD